MLYFLQFLNELQKIKKNTPVYIVFLPSCFSYCRDKNTKKQGLSRFRKFKVDPDNIFQIGAFWM
jgi:hypothetical protein